MRVAFLLNAYNREVDYQNAELSNPGIGGTEFLFWTTSYFLKKYHEDMQVYLFSNGDGPFPDNLIQVKYNSEIEIFEYCRKYNIEYLVIRGPYIKDTMNNLIRENSQKTIVWSHNLENFPTIKRIEKNPYIVKNVCVSNEQLFWLKDTRLYGKSTYIYNGLCFNEYKKIRVEKHPYRICYIGNLYPRSGIETVAYVWKRIKVAIPNAELWIIGGNNLYNVDVMRESYSKKSFKRLNDFLQENFYIDGELDKNVHFTGVLRGQKKLDVMASAQLGIANITDAGDTFGLGTVEFQALGIPVISIGKYGILETIRNKETGILVDNKKQLAEEIIMLLREPKCIEVMASKTKSFVYNMFDIKKIANEWYKLLSDVDQYKAIIFENTRMYDEKNFLKINCNLKRKTLFKWLPPVSFYKYIFYGIRRVLEKIEVC